MESPYVQVRIVEVTLGLVRLAALTHEKNIFLSWLTYEVKLSLCTFSCDKFGLQTQDRCER